MNPTVSLGGSSAVLSRWRLRQKPCLRHTDPWAKVTEKEAEFLAPYIAAWHDADDAGREPGVRLEDPEGAEDEFNGLADEPDVWWEGEEWATHNRYGEVVTADGLLPSERLARRSVVRL